MKKLMFAAAIVCAVACAQAAQSARWRADATEIYNGTGSSASSDYYKYGTAYVFDSAKMSQSDLFDIFKNGGTISSTTAGCVSLGTVGEGGAFMTDDFLYGDRKAADPLSFYFAIVETDKIYFSNIVSVMAAKTATIIDFGCQYGGSSGADSVAKPLAKNYAGEGAWSSVPEPTSGLLMLLGMAGLCLRRKQRG